MRSGWGGGWGGNGGYGVKEECKVQEAKRVRAHAQQIEWSSNSAVSVVSVVQDAYDEVVSRSQALTEHREGGGQQHPPSRFNCGKEKRQVPASRCLLRPKDSKSSSQQGNHTVGGVGGVGQGAQRVRAKNRGRVGPAAEGVTFFVGGDA